MDDEITTEEESTEQKDVADLLREIVEKEQSRVFTVEKNRDVFNVELIEANGMEFRSLQDKMARLQVHHARLTGENKSMKALIEKMEKDAEEETTH